MEKKKKKKGKGEKVSGMQSQYAESAVSFNPGSRKSSVTSSVLKAKDTKHIQVELKG